MTRQSRRSFLKTSLAALGGIGLHTATGWGAGKRLPVAGVATEYRRNSHAHVILGKILEGFNQDAGPGPGLELVSLYVDQFPENDMSRGLAKKHGFRLTKSIDEAITLGGDRVEVAGVLCIGEHGDYPRHPVTGQKKYPRKRFFDETVVALKRGGKVVPVFSDKHLSYSTREALAMYRTAKELKIPFMAGSSLPVAWRIPALDLPMGCEIESALAVGYGGLESYGFHALETLQCMIERRKGGETGVNAVRAVRGEAVLEAESKGFWSRELLAAALRAQSLELPEDWRGWLGDRPFYLIEYRDGLKAAVAMLQGLANNFSFAARLKGRDQPVSTWFALQDGPPYGHFAWLVRAIERMIHSGKPTYPVERTLLTTGILDAAMHSLVRDEIRIATPELKVSYDAVHWQHAPGRPPKAQKSW